MQTELKITPNYSKLTFTIRKNGSKFRTEKMSKEEFNESLYNTSNDWQNYLRTNQSYKLIN